MARHHIVPQLLLRRFAADGRMLMATPRQGGPSIPMTVRKACAESSFYDLELDPPYDEEVSPEFVEGSLSHFEGKAAGIIDRLIGGEFSLTDWDRFYLTLFVSLQLVRGWSFRRDLSGLMTEAARAHLEVAATPERIADWLVGRGERGDAEAVADFHRRVLTSDWKVTGAPTAYVQAMLRLVFEDLHPRFFLARRIRVLRFDRPSLITSDQPAVLWARPTRDLNVRPLGAATADAVWLPLDRRHALALISRGEEGIVDSGPLRAGQINKAVATAAARWVFQHPDDDHLELSRLPPPERFVTETTGMTVDGEEVRVHRRIIKRPWEAR